MLSRNLRAAILELHQQGHGTRAIQKLLQISRAAIRRVICSQNPDPPPPPSFPGRRWPSCPQRSRSSEPKAFCKASLRLALRGQPQRPQRRH